MKFLKTLKSLFTPVPRIAAADGADAIRAGRALLVDVREPGEWRAGVASEAALLPLSDLTGARKQWKAFLETVQGREVFLYCAAGGRSAIAARLLAGEGFRTADAGGLREWIAAGWPLVEPSGGRAGSRDPKSRNRRAEH